MRRNQPCFGVYSARSLPSTRVLNGLERRSAMSSGDAARCLHALAAASIEILLARQHVCVPMSRRSSVRLALEVLQHLALAAAGRALVHEHRSRFHTASRPSRTLVWQQTQPSCSPMSSSSENTPFFALRVPGRGCRPRPRAASALRLWTTTCLPSKCVWRNGGAT